VLRLVKEATEHGTSAIVFSHNMEHVIEVADRAVVLRQGRYVGEAEPTKDRQEKLVSMIVGGGEDS
jgi:ABC-type sugar transport system ATPase subunit